MTKFAWGAATSAHQVEGQNVHSDWWDWERSGGGVEPSGRAADQYNRYAEDFALARELGHTAHRLSLEWSRLEPAADQWDESAFAHYEAVLRSLRDNNLRSFVTLHHFTNPLWFSRQGGWLQREAPLLFRRYVQRVVERLGDLVDVWITINEPVLYAHQVYWRGVWPPAEQHAWEHLWQSLQHLAAAHEQAYKVIHQHFPQAEVGVAKNCVAFVPARDIWSDQVAVRLARWWFNDRFLRMTRGTHDFIGINYYFTDVLQSQWRFPFARIDRTAWQGATSDLQWPLRPDGLEQVLLEMSRYKVPLYVTENGLADAKDTRRADFIREHLRAVERAQARGADVRGYLHWSLLDNFEWSHGFGPRFGLVEVDYRTFERKPRRSAYVYKAIIEQAQQ